MYCYYSIIKRAVIKKSQRLLKTTALGRQGNKSTNLQTFQILHIYRRKTNQHITVYILLKS